MDHEISEALQRLPAVDEAVRALLAEGVEGPRWALVRAVREQVAELREQILAGKTRDAHLEPARIAGRVRELCAPSLRPVLNATGVVLHTNLGRAPLGVAALERIAAVAGGYSNLEYELRERRRGSRHQHAAELLRELTGAEDAVVVNNNAAAVMLCLAALARGREVVVSRGELIEIGGSFRLPEVMSASGALLREVGTTNRTHLRDYQGAVGPETALLLKVHRSNFAVVGFVAEVGLEELVALGRERDIPTLFDLGSGSLIDLGDLGLPREPTVQQAVSAGFDLVTFSGDKVLGGPQAGIIAGRAEMIERVRNHPLMRPLRPDKMTLAGLEATLETYRDGDPRSVLPALSMLALPEEGLRRRAGRVRALIFKEVGSRWVLEVVRVASRVGGGAVPQAAPPSWGVALTHPRLGPDRLEGALRRGDPPVLGRIEGGRLLLDLRTVFERDTRLLVEAVGRALRALEQER